MFCFLRNHQHIRFNKRSTCLVKTHDVIPQIGAARGSHDLDTSEVLAELNADLAHLQGQLPCWHHDYGWNDNISLAHFKNLYSKTSIKVDASVKRQGVIATFNVSTFNASIKVFEFNLFSD